MVQLEGKERKKRKARLKEIIFREIANCYRINYRIEKEATVLRNSSNSLGKGKITREFHIKVFFLSNQGQFSFIRTYLLVDDVTHSVVCQIHS